MTISTYVKPIGGEKRGCIFFFFTPWAISIRSHKNTKSQTDAECIFFFKIQVKLHICFFKDDEIMSISSKTSSRDDYYTYVMDLGGN